MKTTYLHLNSRDEFLRIDVSKIVYFEADANYTNIVLANKLKGVVSMNLSHMQEILVKSLGENARMFARIGKKYIINHKYVYQINPINQRLLLSDGDRFAFQLQVSKEALKKLKELYIK